MTRLDEVLNYLYGLQRVGIKLGLDNIYALLDAIGQPHKKLQTIHIAGTNGKGSTAAFLKSILQAQGYTVALYTSPHLVRFNERIRINDVLISDEEIVAYTEKLRPHIDRLGCSFFEATTALAFAYFAEKSPDIAIIETGLGGRLDATNVLSPILTLITPVDFDHREYLGNTLRQIAGEKAGIIKPAVPCLTNNTSPEVLSVLQTKCREQQSPFINIHAHGQATVKAIHFQSSLCDIELFGNCYDNITVGLPGSHQINNAMLALAAVHHLPESLKVENEAIYRGLAHTHWVGRIHQISKNPNIVVDVSHNPLGFQKTFEFIRAFYSKNQIRCAIFLQRDKDAEKIAEILSEHCSDVYVILLNAGKPFDGRQFAVELRRRNVKTHIVRDVESFISRIEACESESPLWLMIGSHYLAGEFYRLWAQNKFIT
jgi:dihydrofolate synthase/folylpolyglutamate synthase